MGPPFFVTDHGFKMVVIRYRYRHRMGTRKSSIPMSIPIPSTASVDPVHEPEPEPDAEKAHPASRITKEGGHPAAFFRLRAFRASVVNLTSRRSVVDLTSRRSATHPACPEYS